MSITVGSVFIATQMIPEKKMNFITKRNERNLDSLLSNTRGKYCPINKYQTRIINLPSIAEISRKRSKILTLVVDVPLHLHLVRLHFQGVQHSLQADPPQAYPPHKFPWPLFRCT